MKIFCLSHIISHLYDIETNPLIDNNQLKYSAFISHLYGIEIAVRFVDFQRKQESISNLYGIETALHFAYFQRKQQYISPLWY